MISALVLLIALQQAPVQAPAWVGKWEGHYTLENDKREFLIKLEISAEPVSKGDEVDGTYDHRTANGNDWQFGSGHGFVEKDMVIKILFRFGSRESWGQLEGKLLYDPEKKTFTCESATMSTPSPDEEKRKPKPAKVYLKRPSE